MFTAFLIAVLFGTSLALVALLVAGPATPASTTGLSMPKHNMTLTLVSLLLILATLGIAQLALA